MEVTAARRVVLDTGALVALADVAMGRSRDVAAMTLLADMYSKRLSAFSPTVVIAEWWRGEDGPAARVRDSVAALDVPKDIAIDAGRLLAAMPDDPTRPAELLVVDAIVVVAASRRLDEIYTRDPDLTLLRDKLVAMGKIAKGTLQIHRV